VAQWRRWRWGSLPARLVRTPSGPTRPGGTTRMGILETRIAETSDLRAHNAARPRGERLSPAAWSATSLPRALFTAAPPSRFTNVYIRRSRARRGSTEVVVLDRACAAVTARHLACDDGNDCDDRGTRPCDYSAGLVRMGVVDGYICNFHPGSLAGASQPL
jgi:hypothetical protein